MPAEVSERSRIMEAAHRCLAANNGEAVSVTDILREAGLSTRAFYRHFGSKDDLLIAMFRYDRDRVLARLRAAVAAAQSPADSLRAWIEGYLGLASGPRRRQRVDVLSSAEIRRASGYGVERTDWMAQHQAEIAAILRQGVRDGSFPMANAEPDAGAIHAMITEALAAQFDGSARVSAAESAGQLIDFAFRALGVTRHGV